MDYLLGDVALINLNTVCKQKPFMLPFNIQHVTGDMKGFQENQDRYTDCSH